MRDDAARKNTCETVYAAPGVRRRSTVNPTLHAARRCALAAHAPRQASGGVQSHRSLAPFDRASHKFAKCQNERKIAKWDAHVNRPR